MKSIPGFTDPDVLQLAQLLPGVSSFSSKPSDIYIRGCTPDQNLLLWEDIPIYHSAHYFGMISAFNPYISDEVVMHRGGFSADYGGRTGSIIAINNDHTGQKYHGVGINSNSMYIYGHEKFGNSFLNLSARRSYSELFKTPHFDNLTKNNQQGFLLGSNEIAELPDHIVVDDEFNFHDFHGSFLHKMGKTRIKLAGLYAYNDFNDEIIDDVKMQRQDDKMDLKNIGGSAEIVVDLGKNLDMITLATYSHFEYDYIYNLKNSDGDSKIAGKKDNSIQDIQFDIALEKHIKRLNWKAGYNLTNYNVSFKSQEESKNSKDINDMGSDQASLHSLYLNLENEFRSSFTLEGGVRSSYFQLSEQFYLEPRIKLSYNVSENLSFHFNYGKYHQFINRLSVFRGNENGINLSIWSLANESNIKVQLSNMFQLGALYRANDWFFEIQGYSRLIKGINSRTYDFDNISESQFYIGDSNINGLDILIRKKFRSFQSWLSYTLSETTFNFRNYSMEDFPADHDQRHIIKWTNQWEFGKFNASIGFRYASALPFTKIVDFEIQNNPQSNEPVFANEYSRINDFRLDPLIEMNVAFKYQIDLKKSKLHLSLACINLSNHNNIYHRNYYIESLQNQAPEIDWTNTSSLPFTPDFSLRYEF